MSELCLEKPKYNDSGPYSQYHVKCDYIVNSDHVNWMFENQDPNTINAILGSSNTVGFDGCELMPFDFYCLRYCIAQSHCQWKLVFGKEANTTLWEGMHYSFQSKIPPLLV